MLCGDLLKSTNQNVNKFMLDSRKNVDMLKQKRNEK